MARCDTPFTGMVSPVLSAIQAPIPLELIATGVILLVVFLQLVALARLYRRVNQGQALIRNGAGGTRVSFTGLICFPFLHKVEFMDLTAKRLNASFRDANSLKTRDDVEVEIVAAFLVRIAPMPEDILKAASSVGAARAGDQETLDSLFQSRFSDALQAAVRESDFEFIDQRREAFRDLVRQHIGAELGGYTLDSIALDHFGKRDWTAD